MAHLARHTWSFSGPGGTRFHETWVCQADNFLDCVPSRAGQEIIDRLPLLNPLCTFNSISVKSITDGSIPPVQVRVGFAGQSNLGTAQPANAKEAAVFNIVCTDGTKTAGRKLWMRGIDEDAVQRSAVTGNDILDANFENRFNIFIHTLTGSSAKGSKLPRVYGMLPRKRVGGVGGQTKFQITKVEKGSSSSIANVFADDLIGISADDYIVINGASPKAAPGLRGIFKVIANVGGSVRVSYKTPSSPIDCGGYFYKYEAATFLPVSFLLTSFAFMGSRDTKKLDINSRGRRPAKRLRQ